MPRPRAPSNKMSNISLRGVFALRTIDFRYFSLFVLLCDGFKCLFKGSVLRKWWQHAKLLTQQTHLYKTWKDSLPPVTNLQYLLTKNPGDHAKFLSPIFFKIRVFFHTPYLWNGVDEPHFFLSFLTQLMHYPTPVKRVKENPMCVLNQHRNVISLSKETKMYRWIGNG